jgi:predicted nucleic acid-binding protein
MSAYIDSALFVKLYVLEANSIETIRILDEIGEPFLYSHLHDLEIQNAIRLKRFRGKITKAQEAAAIRAFLADVDAGRFERIACDLGDVFLLDLWHVAAAVETGCSTFASYDTRQREVAALCGLKVIPNQADNRSTT